MIIGQPVYSHSPVEAERGVCAAGHPLAAEAAIRVMRKGGNAVDGLTAAAFASFVVEPASCGIGGYGHISLWLAEQARFVSIDAYCRAPGAARADLFEVDKKAPATYYGHPFTKGNKAMVGPLAVSVPGAVAGFCQAQENFGRLPLKAVLAPAIEAAEAGVAFTFTDKLGIAERALGVDLLADASAFLLPSGRLPDLGRDGGRGDRMDGRALAGTLKRIAEKGAAGFYAGPVAREISRYLRRHGGLVSTRDLADYRTRTLLERPARYRGLRYVSCFDQVAYEALNILDHYDLASYGPDSYAYRHLVAEALAVAFADSMAHYGDPDFVDSPVDGLSSPAFAAVRRKLIRLRKALPRPVVAGDPWPHAGSGTAAARAVDPVSLAPRPGTSQAAVADADGNMASCCISIGSSFGALVYLPNLGIVLNNAMQNYDPRPGRPNSIAPGKMPIFAAPALVAGNRKEAVFAASGSGGYRIETGILHTFMNWLDHRMALQQAVDHPRVHCQGEATHVDPRIPGSLRKRLAKAGHQVIAEAEVPGVWPYGRVCAVARVPRRKTLSAGAGPSWQTAIAGF